MKRSFVVFIVCLTALFIVTQIAQAQEKITGPWLWMIAPTEANLGGADSTDIDSLAAASGDAVTEDDVATNGASEGDQVGDLAWTLAELPATGGDNLNEVVVAAGLGAGDVNDHSAYGLITIESAVAQNDVTMRVGSDDSIKVWLNGEVVHTNAVNRGAGDFQDDFPVNLVQGDNLLLVKVSERGGGWSMFVGINTSFTAAGKSYILPGPKIEGPWLWVIAPTEGKCGQDATEDDWLAAASGGSVTEERVSLNGTHGGQRVGDVVWTSAKISPEGGNNINVLIEASGLGTGDINNHVAYGFIRFDSPADQNTQMFIGSDDAVKVWLNGDVVHENKVNRGAGDYQDTADVTLRAGTNNLLVAVYECGGGFSGFFGFDATAQTSFLLPVSVEPAGKMVTTWGRLKRGF